MGSILNVGLFGLGTVGRGVYNLIQETKPDLEQKKQ